MGYCAWMNFLSFGGTKCLGRFFLPVDDCLEFDVACVCRDVVCFVFAFGVARVCVGVERLEGGGDFWVGGFACVMLGRVKHKTNPKRR